jgi:DNA topoisomerase-3
LPEDIVKELFETGKTKQKVTGFISKAGNPFETCLKFENERIQFDFDNPGEVSAPKSDDNGGDELPWLSPQGEAVTITAQPDVAESNFLESKLHEI